MITKEKCQKCINGVKHVGIAGVLAHVAHIASHIVFPISIVHELVMVAVFAGYFLVRKLWTT